MKLEPLKLSDYTERGGGPLRDCLSVHKWASGQWQFTLARNLWVALGEPKCVSFLKDGAWLGIVGDDGTQSRKLVFNPATAKSPAFRAIGLTKAFPELQVGRYPARVERVDGRSVVLVDLTPVTEEGR